MWAHLAVGIHQGQQHLVNSSAPEAASRTQLASLDQVLAGCRTHSGFMTSDNYFPYRSIHWKIMQC
jgi:hypothetical protein